MPGLSIHVIDIARGVAAAGLAVEILDAAGMVLGSAKVGAGGNVHLPDLAARPMPPGLYEARFHVGAFYRRAGFAIPEPAFLETVVFRFGVADPAQHYHLPLKVSPWGFSLFRGGV